MGLAALCLFLWLAKLWIDLTSVTESLHVKYCQHEKVAGCIILFKINNGLNEILDGLLNLIISKGRKELFYSMKGLSYRLYTDFAVHIISCATSSQKGISKGEQQLKRIWKKRLDPNFYLQASALKR